MMMTKFQAEHLAHLCAALRASAHPAATRWDAAGILSCLEATRPKADADQVAIAAIQAAMDPTNRTPAVIGMDGEHWQTPRRTTPKPPPFIDRSALRPGERRATPDEVHAIREAARRPA